MEKQPGKEDHMKKPTRIDAAIRLRDHALTIIRQHGSYQPISTGQRFLMWKGDSFGLFLQTPFQNLNSGTDVSARSLAAPHGLTLDHAKYLATLHGIKLPEYLPYCLDISQRLKVMSLEWSDDGRARIVSFRRGPWEAEFLALSPEETSAA
jgi:hypothetical protein